MTDENCKKVLLTLVSLYAAWSLEKHLPNLHMGGYFTETDGRNLREVILQLCAELKKEAVALVDVVAPPDFVLNSFLGVSDGDVYSHMKSELFSSPNTFTKPDWWQDILKTGCVSKL